MLLYCPGNSEKEVVYSEHHYMELRLRAPSKPSPSLTTPYHSVVVSVATEAVIILVNSPRCLCVCLCVCPVSQSISQSASRSASCQVYLLRCKGVIPQGVKVN